MLKIFSKIYQTIVSTLINLAVGLIFGGCCGAIAALGIMFLIRHWFWAALIAAFFSIFHVSDLKTFWQRRHYSAFFLRLAALLFLSSSISGFVWLATEPEFYFYDGVLALGFIAAGSILLSFYLLLSKFGSRTRFFQALDQTIDGLYVFGVKWKNE